ncbi:hypothetical protein D9613_006667 [Agrocybe pediades]|uniref:Uncharacterized protein n=1 Tax=Agrocybe pediades TaxID=84607 RepID=A0A8H4VIS4_9AGAR|nr:hypothetical protein D9613_006667 [Agrocybe pediades]
MPFRLELLDASNSPEVVLYRRRSSLKIGRRQSSLNNYEKASNAPRFPMEILENIVKFLVTDWKEPITLIVFKKFVGPCALASKDLRYLALRIFFRHLGLKNIRQSRALLDYLANVDSGYQKQGWTAGYVWVRSLSSPHAVIPTIIKELTMLTNLKTINVDMDNSGLMLQRTYIDNLFASLGKAEITTNIESLTLTNVPRIDIHLLTLVAKQFPRLVQLHLASAHGIDMDCCVSCYEESLSRISHSPIPDVFCDASSLGHAFGRALAPLSMLSTLFLGVYLSPADLLDRHMSHGSQADTCTGIRDMTLESVYNCSRCHDYRQTTKENELLATHVLAERLESVETISWNTCFATRTYDGRFLEKENTVEGSLDCRLDAKFGEISNDDQCQGVEGMDHDAQGLRQTVFLVHKAIRIRVARVL